MPRSQPRTSRAATTRRRGRSQARPRRSRKGRLTRPARRAPGAHVYTAAAATRLKRFRQSSRLAVALTAILLLLWGLPAGSEEPAAAKAGAPADPSLAVSEAAVTLRELLNSLYSLLPKLAIAVAILVAAALLSRAVKFVLTRTLGSWSRAAAIGAISQVIIILVALGASLSVIAGDARALVGSVGLAGLALSWALQTPIESFTGWILNSLRSYYRVGDRIEVGDVFGDVFKIDILTTTVWEAGGEGKAVHGAQPTGALITFPNSEVLRSNIINYTRDFPYVWDEVVQGVANESDLRYSITVLKGVASRVIGGLMREPAQAYLKKIAENNLAYEVATEPTVFASPTDAWTNLTVRYLVPARERRRWSSELLIEISNELARPEHRDKIIPSLPRARIEVLPPEANRRSGSPAA